MGKSEPKCQNWVKFSIVGCTNKSCTNGCIRPHRSLSTFWTYRSFQKLVTSLSKMAFFFKNGTKFKSAAVPGLIGLWYILSLISNFQHKTSFDQQEKTDNIFKFHFSEWVPLKLKTMNWKDTTGIISLSWNMWVEAEQKT